MTKTATDIAGWMDGPELRWLEDRARGAKISIEVGVWRGRSTFAIAETHRKYGGISFAIDHFGGAREIMRAHESLGGVDAIRTEAIGHLADFIEGGHLVLVELESTVAYHHLYHVLGPSSVDFVFIDGSHNYAPAMFDIANFFNLLRKDCILAVHDNNLPSVQRAIADAVGGADVREGPGSISYVVK